MTKQTQLVDEQDCPCFMGGSCPTNYEHADDLEGFGLARVKEILKNI